MYFVSITVPVFAENPIFLKEPHQKLTYIIEAGEAGNFNASPTSCYCYKFTRHPALKLFRRMNYGLSMALSTFQAPFHVVLRQRKVNFFY
jgi:hypothetical protein